MASDFISSVLLVPTTRNSLRSLSFPAVTLASVGDSGQERFDYGSGTQLPPQALRARDRARMPDRFRLTLSLTPAVRSLHPPAC